MVVAYGLILIVSLIALPIFGIRAMMSAGGGSAGTWAVGFLIAAVVALAGLANADKAETDAREAARSEQLGFANVVEMQRAAQHGIDNPGQWATKRAELEKQEAALAKERADNEAFNRAAIAEYEAKQADQTATGQVVYDGQTLSLDQQRAALSRERAGNENFNRAAIAKYEAEQAAQKDMKGGEDARFRCLSRWDGSMRDLVDAVTKTLRDPSSFEHIETFASSVKPGGQQYVTMRFRARNGYGGLNVSQAKATVQNDRCTIVTWSMS